jgi:VCBS repeat-containing protein
VYVACCGEGGRWASTRQIFVGQRTLMFKAFRWHETERVLVAATKTAQQNRLADASEDCDTALLDDVCYTVILTDMAGASASQDITIKTFRTNDKAVIEGVSTVALIEDAAETLTASGVLTVADIDDGKAMVVAQAETAGSNVHDTFTLTSDGT